MNLKVNDRVGLCAKNYRGPINFFNPVWDSFVGRIAGTVECFEGANGVADRVRVAWDNERNRDQPSYSPNELFLLTPDENTCATMWGRHHIDDTRDLIFLAFLPDQMFHFGASFYLTPEDRSALGSDDAYLMIAYGEPLGSFKFDGALIASMLDSPYLLLGFSNNSHFNSLARFHHLHKLPEPRAVPRMVHDLGQIATAMHAVPEGLFSRARAVFTVRAHRREDKGLTIYDLLATYSEVRAQEAQHRAQGRFSQRFETPVSGRTILG